MLQALTVSALTLIPALIVKADGKLVRLDVLFIPEWMGYGYVSMCLWSTCVVTQLLRWARMGRLTTPGLVALLCSINFVLPRFLCWQHGHVFRGLQLLGEDSEVYCSAPNSDIGARYWTNLTGTRCELHAFDTRGGGVGGACVAVALGLGKTTACIWSEAHFASQLQQL